MIARPMIRAGLPAVFAAAIACAGCGYLSELAPTSCVEGGTECDGACVDTETSAQHCGGCGQACDEWDVCVEGRCVAPCTDGIRDGAETDVDCGGGCQPCEVGRSCAVASDCLSGSCDARTCKAASTCSDGVMNGSETGIDCGGGCGPCGPSCSGPADCPSGVCIAGHCAGASCSDGVHNGDEVDVDCGGSCGARCDAGKRCRTTVDCFTPFACVHGVCAQPTCTDGVTDGSESGVDCGGSCPGCPVGEKCWASTDCATGTCQAGVCAGPSCTDGKKNGTETDVDCGGGCPGCKEWKQCAAATDCESAVCVYGTCYAASCTDKVRNGAESDVDCGGTTCAKCKSGRCNGPADCASGTCNAGSCAVAYGLAVTVSGNTTGKVTSTPAGIDCPGTCSATFAEGAVVTLSAVPAAGNFGGWTGACAGLGACAVTMNADAAVGASFTDEQPAEWARVATPGSLNNNVWLTDIVEDAAGNAYVVANVDGDAEFAGTTVTTPGATGVMVAKLGPTGTPVFVKVLGGASDCRALKIAVDAAGFALAGNFTGTVDFGGGPLTSTEQDAFVARFDPAGAHQWSHAIGGAGAQGATGVAIRNGNVYVVGNDGWSHLLLSQYDSAGALGWSKRFVGGIMPARIAASPNGGVVVAGTFFSSVDSASLDLGGGPLSPQGTDLFLAHFLDDGTHDWSRTYIKAGSRGQCDLHSVAIDSTGRIAVGGMQNGNVDFGATWTGKTGPFFGVVDASGTPQFSGIVEPGYQSGATVPAVAFAPDRSLFVANAFSRTVSPTGGSAISTTLGTVDGLLLKYGVNGGLAWARRIGDAQGCHTEVTALAVGGGGHIYPAGQARGCTAFGATLMANGIWQTPFAARLVP